MQDQVWMATYAAYFAGAVRRFRTVFGYRPGEAEMDDIASSAAWCAYQAQGRAIRARADAFETYAWSRA